MSADSPARNPLDVLAYLHGPLAHIEGCEDAPVAALDVTWGELYALVAALEALVQAARAVAEYDRLVAKWDSIHGRENMTERMAVGDQASAAAKEAFPRLAAALRPFGEPQP